LLVLFITDTYKGNFETDAMNKTDSVHPCNPTACSNRIETIGQKAGEDDVRYLNNARLPEDDEWVRILGSEGSEG
jgi:hypothetical protein